MKGCRSIRRLVLRESDQRLGVDEAFVLEEHLERCAACRRFREVELEIREALALSLEPSLSGAELERALADVRAELAREHDAPRASFARRASLAAGIALVLGAGFLALWRLRHERSPSPAVALAPAPALPEPASAKLASADLPTASPERTAAAAPSPEAPSPEPAPRTPAELRERLRADLRAAFAGWRAGEDPSAGLAAFAERTDGLARAWPLERFLEELVLDPDGELASAAARVLGARGERLSAPALRAALERPDVAPSAVAALGELGSAGLPGLARALAAPALEPLALEALVTVGGEPAALVLEHALASERVEPARERERARSLAALGAPAIAALLRLCDRDRERRELFLSAMERVSGSADALVPLLAGEHGSRELCYEAALRLPSPGALAWLRERCLEREERDRALATLARWEGVEPLEVALELWSAGRLTGEDADALVTDLLARDPRRARALASELVASRSSAAGALLELLLACGAAHSGSACATLAEAALPEDQRLLAALAAGELGEPGDLALLASAFQRADPRERRLRAALLLSIHRLAGEEGVAQAFAGQPRDEGWSTLLQALEEAGVRGAAVSVHRVARALDGLAPRPREAWRST